MVSVKYVIFSVTVADFRLVSNRVITEEDKLADLRYKLTRKDARIKQLEMENELMRDFLSLTERK